MAEHQLHTQQQLADFAGVSKGLVNQWFNGDTGLGAKPLLAFEKKTNFSPQWLADGKGEKYKNPLQMPPAGSILVTEEFDTTYTHKEIPLYTYTLSAGLGNSVWVESHQESPLVFREKWFRSRDLSPENLRAMRVKGDSMKPELNDWDTVIIDISDQEIIDGQIYALIYKERLYIKRIKYTEDGILLVSSNTEYGPMEVTKETADRFQLLGRMVWRGG